MQEISHDELRDISAKGIEGLIIQGCGGDLREWADGINGLLTDAGILRNGTHFENVMAFQNKDVICLLFPFEDGIDVDMGKLAMWRLSTHGDLGSTWLSDYITNYLPEKLKAPEKPKIKLVGEDGNIFVIMSRASIALNRAGLAKEAEEMRERVKGSGSYHEALRVVSEYVETELSPQTQAKSRKRGSHER